MVVNHVVEVKASSHDRNRQAAVGVGTDSLTAGTVVAKRRSAHCVAQATGCSPGLFSTESECMRAIGGDAQPVGVILSNDGEGIGLHLGPKDLTLIVHDRLVPQSH